MITKSEIARMIDHSILHPTYTEETVIAECNIAKTYAVATVCVKPHHTKLAAQLLAGTDIGICTVIGFPHGNSTIAAKVFETECAIQDGATEIDMVITISKALEQDWEYIAKEIGSIQDVCKKHHAVLKVIFETDFVTQDADKIKLCEICNDIGVGFVKTSTGYGFVKTHSDLYTYTGATEHDISLMRTHCKPEIQIKASGGIRTFEQLLRMKEAGASRVGATATAAILGEMR